MAERRIFAGGFYGETNLFSTYLMAYKDESVPTPTETAKPTTVPKTGDASMPFLWLMLVITGILGIGVMTVVRRRR